MNTEPSPHPCFLVELFGSDPNGRKMIAWGRRVGCRDAGHGFEPGGRGVYTRLLVDDADPQQHNFLMELVDYPAGLRAINQAQTAQPPPSSPEEHTGSGWRGGSGTCGSRTRDPRIKSPLLYQLS